MNEKGGVVFLNLRLLLQRLSTIASLAIRPIKSSSLVLTGGPSSVSILESERLTDFLGMRFSDEEDGGELLSKYCDDHVEDGVEK